MEDVRINKWLDLLVNMDLISPTEWFAHGQQITRDLESFEEHKRETRRLYNDAVDNYNNLVIVFEKIQKALNGNAKIEDDANVENDAKIEDDANVENHIPATEEAE